MEGKIFIGIAIIIIILVAWLCYVYAGKKGYDQDAWFLKAVGIGFVTLVTYLFYESYRKNKKDK